MIDTNQLITVRLEDDEAIVTLHLEETTLGTLRVVAAKSAPTRRNAAWNFLKNWVAVVLTVLIFYATICFLCQDVLAGGR